MPMKWGWITDAIQDLFYQKGRMPRLPTIYKPVGTIYNYWEDHSVIGVDISENILHLGDHIGYLLPNGFLEEKVTSLQVDNKDVKEANIGQKAGIKTKYPKDVLKKKMIVYSVSSG